MNGNHNMRCRPAGFSDDDSDSDDDSWQNIKTAKASRAINRYVPNPQRQFEEAIKSGDLNAVKEAMNNGVNVDAVDSAGYTGLMIACSYAHPDIVNYLIEQHSQVNACTPKLIYPLMVVCFSSSHDESASLTCARRLLDAYANPDTVDVHGTTALMFAAKSGRLRLVEELVSRGANVRATDTQRWTALHHAANAGDAATAAALVAAGAKRRARDAAGRRPFEIAAARTAGRAAAEATCPRGLRHLLDAGADGEAADAADFRCAETPLETIRRRIAAVDSNLAKPRPTRPGDTLNLYEFLTTADEELRALGLARSWHRRQTLEFVNAYVKQPWPRVVQSRPSRSSGAIAKWNAERGVPAAAGPYPEPTYVGSAHLAVNVATRLTIVRASLENLRANFDGDEVDDDVRLHVKLAAMNARLLETEARRLLRSLDRHDRVAVLPADLIVGRQEGGRAWGWGWVAVVGVAAAVAVSAKR